jgi:hypothetical protein
MLIVGASGALTAIAVFFVWVSIKQWRVRRRMRQAEKRAAPRRLQEKAEQLPVE